MAATLSADALSTQRGLAYPGFREMNPIARPFVQTRAGGAIYTAGSFAVLAGGMYVAHKKACTNWSTSCRLPSPDGKAGSARETTT